MWKKIVKTGLLSLGICCLGLTAGPDVQAAGLPDASSRAAAAQKQYARMMDNQPTGLEQTDPELDSMMKKIYLRRHRQPGENQPPRPAFGHSGRPDDLSE